MLEGCGLSAYRDQVIDRFAGNEPPESLSKLDVRVILSEGKQ
jgi:hypothetical protein